jgi:hypothetical protein
MSLERLRRIRPGEPVPDEGEVVFLGNCILELLFRIEKLERKLDDRQRTGQAADEAE